MNVKHLGLIALTAVVAAGLAGMSTSNAGAAVAAAPANCVIRTYNGNYVTAVGGGGWSTDSPSNPAFHTNATRIQAWEKFRLVPVNTGRAFTVAIETTQNWIWTAQGGGGRNSNVMTTGTGIGAIDTWETFQVICGL